MADFGSAELMETPGEHRPESFPPSNSPDTLPSNMQNLRINQQQLSSIGDSVPRTSNALPFGQQPPPFAAGESRPPSPGLFRRAPPPPAVTLPPNIVPARPTGPPPVSQHASFASRPPPPGVLPSSIGGPAAPLHSGTGPRSGPFSSAALTSGPPTPPQISANGPPGMMQSGLRTTPPMGNVQRPSVAPAQSPTMLSSGASAQPLQTRPGFGTPPSAVSCSLGQAAPMSSAIPRGSQVSAPSLNMPPPPGSRPFPAPLQGTIHSSGYLYGMKTWPQQPSQLGAYPSIPGPPPLPNKSIALGQTGEPNIDPSQIPRFTSSSAVILHETRINNQANPPPPTTNDYIVKDTGNCSPRYMRCTLNKVPCTADLLSTSAMQLALLVQPLALPHPAEEPIHAVDFGESGPIRCSRCRGYINPFMKFIDQGRSFICNFCGFTNETPRDYHCNLGADGRRRDADERPELCRGTVEFIPSKEYMVRDPMPAVFFFLVDVSMHAIQTGATAAACSAINQVIPDLPEGPRTMVGIATFDSTIHFYNLKRTQQQMPLMLIVPDIQDVYAPLESDIIVQLTECRQHLEILLESIPETFQNNKTADSAFGAAAKAAFLAMKNTGGKLLIFQSTGIGSLSARETEGRSNISAGEKEPHKLVQPLDKTLKNMAIEFAEYQVCVDLFITTRHYVDIASLSVVPRTTGGQVYYYYPFSVLSDPVKLFNDLRWNVTRPQGFEAAMCVRCSQGIQVQEYSGNLHKQIPTDVDLPAIDCDKTIMVSLKHDDKLQEESECAFQCALLYTTVYGQRRIRVSTLSLPCTNMLTNLFQAADLDAQFSCILKNVANKIPSAPLAQVRDQATNVCTNILYSYRKFCATTPPSVQLIMPEALKLLPLFTLALLKSNGLSSDGRVDDRSFWLSYVSSLPTPLVTPLVYPRMIAIHDLDEKELEDSIIPAIVPLSSHYISDQGIYLLENGVDCFIYVGHSVQQNVLEQIFGISSVEEISNQFNLQQLDNPLSKKLNVILNEIRRQRCSYLRLKFCKKGDSSGTIFSSYLVEDDMPSGIAYPNYMAHIHKQVQTKMN